MSRTIFHKRPVTYIVHFAMGECTEVKNVTQFSRDEDLGLIVIIADKTYLFNSETVTYMEQPEEKTL